MTIATKISTQATNINNAMEIADKHAGLSCVHQDWDKETTTYLFSDNSRLIVNNFEFYAI